MCSSYQIRRLLSFPSALSFASPFRAPFLIRSEVPLGLPYRPGFEWYSPDSHMSYLSFPAPGFPLHYALSLITECPPIPPLPSYHVAIPTIFLCPIRVVRNFPT